MEKKIHNYSYKMIATRINPKSFAQLQAIAERANLKVYYILQVVIDCIIKVFSYSESISNETQEILYKFCDLDRAKKGFSFTGIDLQNLEFSKCLAIISKKGKDIPGIIELEKDGENITENRNTDDILTTFLQAFSPKILRGLQEIKETDKMHNLTDALYFAINNSKVLKDPLHDEILELFNDANNATQSTQVQSEQEQRNKRNANLENISAFDYSQLALYKRPHNMRHLETETTPLQIAEPLQGIAQDFEPRQIADPLRDYEPDFTPDFDPSEIYDPLRDYEPEYI